MVNCINLWILVMLHERHNESFRFIKYIGISEILYNRTYTCYTSMCIMYLTLNEEGEGGLVVEVFGVFFVVGGGGEGVGGSLRKGLRRKCCWIWWGDKEVTVLQLLCVCIH